MRSLCSHSCIRRSVMAHEVSMGNAWCETCRSWIWSNDLLLIKIINGYKSAFLIMICDNTHAVNNDHDGKYPYRLPLCISRWNARASRSTSDEVDRPLATTYEDRNATASLSSRWGSTKATHRRFKCINQRRLGVSEARVVVFLKAKIGRCACQFLKCQRWR